MFDLQFALQLVTALAVGGGTYGALRAAITRALTEALNAKEIGTAAHKRISDHIDWHMEKNG